MLPCEQLPQEMFKKHVMKASADEWRQDQGEVENIQLEEQVEVVVRESSDGTFVSERIEETELLVEVSQPHRTSVKGKKSSPSHQSITSKSPKDDTSGSRRHSVGKNTRSSAAEPHMTSESDKREE